jgi:hypothetical protein
MSAPSRLRFRDELFFHDQPPVLKKDANGNSLSGLFAFSDARKPSARLKYFSSPAR